MGRKVDMVWCGKFHPHRNSISGPPRESLYSMPATGEFCQNSNPNRKSRSQSVCQMRHPGFADISLPLFNVIVIIIIIIIIITIDSISVIKAAFHETVGHYNFRVPQAHFLYNETVQRNFYTFNSFYFPPQPLCIIGAEFVFISNGEYNAVVHKCA